MSVAQSAIVTVWFKGKELAFALGVNISVARLGSVIMGATVPPLYNNYSLGVALLCGTFICFFSLLCAFGLISVDAYAEKKNPNAQKATIGDDEKFKWSDIISFKTSFWLLAVSCVVTYASVFPYIQIASDLIQKKYGFKEDEASNLCFIPYWFSAVLSPFMGFGLDRYGHRAILISISSVILICAFIISMSIPPCTDKCLPEVIPLCMIGTAYSIYAAAIWGSIPYVV